MEKSVDSKRKSRNLSEKKRRDQFNNLINELNSLIDPHFNSNSNSVDDDDDDSCSFAAKQRKMDKSSVLRCAMEFLRKYSTSSQQQHQINSKNTSSSARNNSRFSHDDQCSTDDLMRNNRSLWKPPYITDDEFSVQMLEALDAFILVCEVNPEARIIYSSDALTNLLNYAGTCNSLRYHDYVSLLDLIAPNDRQQIERLFSEETDIEMHNHQQAIDDMPIDSQSCQLIQQQFSRPNNDLSHDYGNNHQTTLQNKYQSYNDTADNNYTGRLGQVYDAINTANNMDYKSMVVNFRVGLNLTEIKQRRLKRRSEVLSRPNSKNHSIDADDHHTQQDEHQQNHRSSSNIELIQQTAQQQDHQQQHHQQASQIQTNDPDDVYKDMVDERESACGRCQQSIAEQQQQLISEGHREQQEQNQHRQQQQRQQHDAQQVLSIQQMQVDVDKRPVPGETANIEDSSNGNDDGQQLCTSDENDQPSSGNGSDDASDSNQSQTLSNDERPRHHHFRHHSAQQSNQHQQQNVDGRPKLTEEQQHGQPKHVPRHSGHHNHKHSSNSPHGRRQKQQIASNSGQQYELVKLMGIFRLFGASDPTMANEDSNHDDGFDDEPTAIAKQKRYFICIGRLDIPRFSYDLKMIVPPMTSGSNIFHNNQFLSKHTLKWRFLWVDNRAPAIIGYLPFEVLGTSGYDYYHWDDLDRMVSTHEDLMRDGQASSVPYRFLTKGQQWIWLQTKYCIILKPQCYSNQQSKLSNSNKNSETTEQQPQQRRSDQQMQPDLNQYHLQSAPRNINLPSMDVEGYGGTYQYETHTPSSHIIFSNEGNQEYLMGLAAQQQNSNQMENFMTPTYTTDQINYEDGPLPAYGSQVQQQPQQHRHTDDGTITYTVTSPGAQIKNGTKRFRPDQYDQRASTRGESIQMHDSGSSGARLCSNGSGNDIGQQVNETANAGLNDEQYINHNQQLIREQQQNEQRRYEKLLKTNDLIKKQSIEAGNSFLSRSLNQFKFILCTHTVIGFDESDTLSTRGALTSSLKCKSEVDNNDLLDNQREQPSALNPFNQQQKCHN